MAKISMGQWRAKLGEAVTLEEAPTKTGMPSMQILKAVRTGRVPLHTFRAADGRVFRMIRTRDIEAYRAQLAAQPVITIEGMKAAFKEMAEN